MGYDINQLLMHGVQQGGSDLHISVNSAPIYRINGQLTPFGEHKLTPLDTSDIAKAMLSPGNFERLLEVGELDFSYSTEDGTRYRVNAFKQRNSFSVAARVIPTDIPTIEQLKLPAIINQLAMKPQGLILVTGPTGSGKSTTLAAMIDNINRTKKRHIITLEDPIEYLHSHKNSIVQQREVGTDTDNFGNGLRAALRQDPDIILVGEMRDLETISTAITAAETGHLVLATLHTNSAAQTINRIIDVFPPHQQGQIRIQLASVLEGIISQRLFLTADKRDRIVATEVLVNHPSVANLIRKEKIDQLDNVMQMGAALGMHTLNKSIEDLIVRGLVDQEQAEPYLLSAGEF